MISGLTVRCDYCQKRAEKVSGREVYPHRPDLFGKTFWRCRPCEAHVGCHPDSTRPLGGLANKELRQARQRAHAAFDPIWKSGGMRRTAAYKWLAKAMSVREIHIGQSNGPTCERIIEVCKAKRKF